MIRINLLSAERPRPKRRGASFQTGQKITVGCTLILAAAALGVAWWYWSIQKDTSLLADEISAAQQETQRLRSLIVQVQQFEERKARLQQRVNLIELLRRDQTGPVHMLDELSRSLPEMLWLTELEQKGNDLTIQGHCSAMTSLSDFVGNLEGSGWFKKPVEIIDSQVEQAQATEGSVIRFTIKAQFAAPGA